jgi:hypothetical protein
MATLAQREQTQRLEIFFGLGLEIWAALGQMLRVVRPEPPLMEH